MKVRIRRVGAGHAPHTCTKPMPDHNEGKWTGSMPMYYRAIELLFSADYICKYLLCMKGHKPGTDDFTMRWWLDDVDPIYPT